MNRIGKNIKKARSEKGYTQEQLAQKLCVTRNTISNYETGHSNPDIEMLQMLAEALKTDPNTLIYGEKKEQSADQTWRKEILKRVIWLVIAGLMMVNIEGNILQVPRWVHGGFRCVSDCICDHWQTDYGVVLARIWKRNFWSEMDKGCVLDFNRQQLPMGL